MYDKESNGWKYVHWTKEEPVDVPRGYFTLFFDQFEIDAAWEEISALTKENKLGHFASMAKEPMGYGFRCGDFTICVHTSPADSKKDQRRVKKVLIEAGFGHAIQKEYRINEENLANKGYFDLLEAGLEYDDQLSE